MKPDGRPRVGLLPLYIELYDRSFRSHRPRMDAFHRAIGAALSARGLEVQTVPLCRVKAEFAAAVRQFEKARVDAIVTLHLAYSPSLESSAALAATRLPVIVLDTTPTYGFGPDQAPDEIMYNHGIHGVQDMCNLLIRNRKPFRIEAGHWQKSDVLDRVVHDVTGARMAAAMRRGRVGLIGPPFDGMGDFAVSPADMQRTLGVKVLTATARGLRARVTGLSTRAVAAEMEAQRRAFDARGLDSAVHARS